MQSYFGKFIPYLFIVVLLLTLANVFFSFQDVALIQHDEQSLKDSNAALFQLDTTIYNLRDAEAANRAFIITGDSTYLSIFTQRSKDVFKSLIPLKEHTRDDIQIKKITDIENELHQRITLLQKGIVVRKEQGLEAAIHFMSQDQGKQVMENIKNKVHSIKTQENQKLEKQEQKEQQSYDKTRARIAVGALLNVLLLFLAYYLVRRELDKRSEVDKQKDNFISMASHELKTPITSLKVYTKVLRKYIPEDKKEGAAYVDKIDAQINRLIALINDLLDVSRIQVGRLEYNREYMDLDELLADTVEAIQGTTRKHQFVIKGKLKRKVYADRYRIYQVLINLLNNAVKYAPNGGKIIVSPSNGTSMATVAIKDYGIGIPEEHQKKIFDRFYRVSQSNDKSYFGLGMGLYISYVIIQRHGGRMWVKSKEGKGSTFYFTLPYEPEKKVSLIRILRKTSNKQ